MTKKHILFIVENNPYPKDTRIFYQAEAAREFGYEVSVISPIHESFSPLKNENINGVEVYRHPVILEANRKLGFMIEYLNAFYWEFFLAIKIFIKKPFHILHGANPPDHIFIIALFFRLFGVKYIFDHHDLTPENYVAKFVRKDFLYRILLLMERMSFSVANISIATNGSYREIAIKRGGKPPQDIFVVRNGPDLTKFHMVPPNNDLRRGFDYLVAYIGVINTQDNIDVLLRVVEYIVRQKGINNIKFTIIGSGPEWDSMVTLCNRMGLSDYIAFTGYIPYNQVFEILSTADLCVNPEHSNPFTDKSTMIKIMEYMVFAKPIVQFATIEGKVTAGDAAVYVENNDEVAFANAIMSLLGNPNKRKEMGEIARQRILHSLNWEIQKENLRKAYAYILS